jgi:hypothetical protein
MRIFPFLVVSFFFAKSTFGQGVLKPIQNGWERIYIKDVGYFDMPPTMEIQNGKYREYADDVREIHGYDTTQITVQQKGLNAYIEDSFKKYARVILHTTMGEDDSYFRSSFDLSFFTPKEKIVVDEMMNNIVKKEVLNYPEFLQGLAKIIEWDSTKVETVNGQVCVHSSFRRQVLDQPIVSVHCYDFHNNDRNHRLVLEFRVNESELWKADFEKIVDSFRITNLK